MYFNSNAAVNREKPENDMVRKRDSEKYNCTIMNVKWQLDTATPPSNLLLLGIQRWFQQQQISHKGCHKCDASDEEPPSFNSTNTGSNQFANQKSICDDVGVVKVWNGKIKDPVLFVYCLWALAPNFYRTITYT